MNYVKEWVPMMSCTMHKMRSAAGKKARVRCLKCYRRYYQNIMTMRSVQIFHPEQVS